MTTALSFSAKPTITGKLVTLRPVRPEDARGLHGVSAESLRLTGTHGAATLEQLTHWYATRADHDDRIDWSIIERETGEWAGEVVLNDLDAANQSCGFRILLAGEAFYGRGLGTEATTLAVGHAFDNVGVNRVELEVYAFNPRARHVYENVGFVHEGARRQALRWQGEWVDAELMAMLAGDWRARLPAGHA